MEHFWDESLTIKPENQEKTCSSTKMFTKNPTKSGLVQIPDTGLSRRPLTASTVKLPKGQGIEANIQNESNFRINVFSRTLLLEFSYEFQ